MRILLAHCFYRSSAPSGEDAVYRLEKKLLEDNGYEVISYEKHNDALEDHHPLKKISTGLEFIWSVTAYQEISALITQKKPDIAHFHNIFPQISSSGYAACRQHQVPVVQTLHNYRSICPNGLLQRNRKPCEKCVEGSLLSSLRHRCYRDSLLATLPMAGMIGFNRLTGRFANHVDRYIALTQFSKSRFIAGGLPEHKISVKPNFVNPLIVESDIDKTSSSRHYLLYIGRLTQEKGIHTLIEACKKTKNLPLKIVGDGELRHRLQTLCIQYGLNVEFLGYQQPAQVHRLLQHARFVIMPSECYEGFPVTIAEAFAYGKPVLGSNLGSINEIIQDNINGRKFAFGSADSLAACMQSMWSDHPQLALMSKNARADFENYYNPDANLKLLQHIYQQVIQRKTIPVT
jgi:glycosyltransferase involved in cell wall biosynthesis